MFEPNGGLSSGCFTTDSSTTPPRNGSRPTTQTPPCLEASPSKTPQALDCCHRRPTRVTSPASTAVSAFATENQACPNLDVLSHSARMKTGWMPRGCSPSFAVVIPYGSADTPGPPMLSLIH